MHKNLAGEHHGKKTFERPRHRSEDNIKVDLKETGWEAVEWIQVAQDKTKQWALMNTVVNILVPSKAGNFLTSRVTISF
jgi:hypothetical protein